MNFMTPRDKGEYPKSVYKVPLSGAMIQEGFLFLNSNPTHRRTASENPREKNAGLSQSPSVRVE